jgi:Ca2+-binding RTX toxin-like protein
MAGDHVYASGGIFRIVVTLTDDDTGQTAARTFALITGVGILDGQLQVVGTKQADDVTINLTGDGNFVAHASFLRDSPRFLPTTGVNSIAMLLCRGDDRATVAGNIGLLTYISGDKGNDRLNGGGGPNILLGGEGNDYINGGRTHDILVGGIGADRIVGNGGDDILIAGTLGGGADPIDQLDEFLSVLSLWAVDRDPARTRQRLDVGGDNSIDKLTGSADKDWFFCDFDEDIVTDLKFELAEGIG